MRAFAQLSMFDSSNLSLITLYDITAKSRINMPIKPITPLISSSNFAYYAQLSYVDNRCV